MLNDARARRLKYTKNASRAIASGPHFTAASDAKNLSRASKKLWNESPAASGSVTEPTLRRGRACQPEHGAQRLLGPGPVLANDRWPRRTHQRAERQREQDRVVELAGDRDEVGHEVDR